MTGWELPTDLTVGGQSWAIHGDFRDVLDVIGWLDGAEGENLLPEERWYVALALFYRDFPQMPEACRPEAAQKLAEFLAGGRTDSGPAGPRLLDWQQDAPMIVAGVNRAAGCEVRALPFLHWWSFLAWFSAIGEGPLATVVAIRDKLRRGKKLEAWEMSYYRAHRAEIDLRPARNEAEQAEHDRLLALLAK